VKRYFQEKLKTKIFNCLKSSLNEEAELDKKAQVLNYILKVKNVIQKLKIHSIIMRNNTLNKEISNEVRRKNQMLKIFNMIKDYYVVHKIGREKKNT